ncbi:hypothetical protein VHEMI01459 [[Torrubiella] hemipterigena]|nr:hypothetical protein VHEMI01459 [[Torrubiella] hemipterigena]
MWILACTASVGYLSRMTQWKTKLNISGVSGLSDKSVGTNLKLGLFSYPVLQAADILVHRATHVPVGDDQKQHLEFARECVTNFNSAYGDHLVHPETITPPAKRVMSLAQPTTKMSKSHKSDRSRILLSDSPQEIRTKISYALTDSLPGISYDPKERPGISNLLEICSIFDAAGRDVNNLANECADMQPRVFKEFVSDTIISGLDGVRDRYLDLMKRSDNYLAKVEEHGAERARQSAQETMDIVKSAIGF